MQEEQTISDIQSVCTCTWKYMVNPSGEKYPQTTIREYCKLCEYKSKEHFWGVIKPGIANVK